MRTDRLAAIALAAALVVAAAPARAGNTKTEASSHFDAGLARAETGDYRAAITEFMRAYELQPSYAVLYNVAKAQESLGDATAAIATYERYLKEGGPAITPERRSKVTAEIKVLAARTGTIVVHLFPASAELTLDGTAVAAAAADKGVRANAGIHQLGATGAGHLPVAQVVTVAAGGTAEVMMALVPVPAPPPAPAPAPVAVAAPPAPPATAVAPPSPAPAIKQPAAPGRGLNDSHGGAQRAIAYILVSAGGVALTTAGALYLLARTDLQKAIDAGCTAMSCTGVGAGHWQDAQNNVTRSRILGIAGGVLLVGGFTIAVMAPPGPVGIGIGGEF